MDTFLSGFVACMVIKEHHPLAARSQTIQWQLGSKSKRWTGRSTRGRGGRDYEKIR